MQCVCVVCIWASRLDTGKLNFQTPDWLTSRCLPVLSVTRLSPPQVRSGPALTSLSPAHQLQSARHSVNISLMKEIGTRHSYRAPFTALTSPQWRKLELGIVLISYRVPITALISPLVKKLEKGIVVISYRVPFTALISPLVKKLELCIILNIWKNKVNNSVLLKFY